MFTDPNRLRRKDPGNPDICNLYQFHRLFSTPELQERSTATAAPPRSAASRTRSFSRTSYRGARADPKRREEIERDPSIVWDVLAAGNVKARERAAETLELTRDAMKLAFRELPR